ncbi:YlxQ-related RNA-binding protein [Enterococcus saccharolyticus]|uniref:50S ribosomal protein L7Ae n=1 Tax=Enterococcus saccharolyticus subsp. saccharolyticus ATCC 43076 TaxID=1139996 RepID=S0NYZ2_9ENTE|nr:YlxQ-related RNA-binding protein [Enterococcus saccharolyticus]EOT28995.1 50S ribosomal protein L7Ae [Enterococcus saccharolyticus subsp. saccharolyticus ATCC 43076]EOT81361.1 50S ribosomal protein L7Ae [Enterococcus saccharolyticus subsp. saccharolyticus ATCC 43076]
MNKQKALNMLGLAMRAGKLVTGEEMTIKDVKSQKAKLVLIAHDAGKNTQKKVKDKSSFYQVPCLDHFDSNELSQAIGKDRMVVGILDSGFAKRIEELILG